MKKIFSTICARIKMRTSTSADNHTPYPTFEFRKCGLKAQWSTQPRASEATPWVSRVGAVAP
ncbi:hypothetical protein, partial [Prevotellamassilia timonensis]|uniref:hypothetical protein n=1 Tax=Prevotellamassilia timonensis TaxID=1852370 RepID=UPI004024F96D